MSRPMLPAKVNPKYLHSNSTSHTWPFSAVAELIDNAYDPDVSANDLWIDYTKINGKTCLVFLDNGAGMDLHHLQQMLSFGYCEKEKYETETASHIPIGHYGNGFKSGSMRLARDALVFTVNKASNTASIGFLSQSLCAARNLDTLILPLMEFVLPDFRRSDNEDINMEDSLEAMLETSPYSKQEELIDELRKLSKQKKQSGTKIVLFGLKRNTNGMSELDFESNQDDIRNPETHEQNHGAIQQESKVLEYRQSLRKYCSILYQKPRMKIFIRGTKVGHFLIQKNLKKTEAYTYKPKGSEKGAEITFGRMGSKSRLEDFGIMFYHRNRLIQPYAKIGRMKENDETEGVVGIVDATHILKPIHNKQAFNDSMEYRSTIKALRQKLDAYLDQVPAEDNEEDERDQWDWVQCERCNKWRRLPAFADVSQLSKAWCCYMNPDQSRNRCEFDEEETTTEYDIPGTNRGSHGPRTPKAMRGGKGRGKGSKNGALSKHRPSDDTDPGSERKKCKLSACPEQTEERSGRSGVEEGEVDMEVELMEASNENDTAAGGPDRPASSDNAACLDLSVHQSNVEPCNDVSGQETTQPARRRLLQPTISTLLPDLAIKQERELLPLDLAIKQERELQPAGLAIEQERELQPAELAVEQERELRPAELAIEQERELRPAGLAIEPERELEGVMAQLRSGLVEELLTQAEEVQPQPLTISSAHRLTRPALNRTRPRSARLPRPGSSPAESEQVNGSGTERPGTERPGTERSGTERPGTERAVGQPACWVMLRRRLYRLLTFLQVRDLWAAGEADSEETVEAMLQRALERYGLDPE